MPLFTRILNYSMILRALLCLVPLAASAALDPISDAEDRRNADAPVLRTGLKSDSARIRARVALAYGRIQQPASVDPLLHLARDPVASLRAAALYNLGQLAWRSEFTEGREGEIALVVADHLSERNREVRLRSIEAIGKIGFSRTPEWMGPLLDDPSASIRAEALMALFRYRYISVKRHPEAPVPLLPDNLIEKMQVLTSDGNAAVRRNLVYGFARFKDRRGFDMALELSRDHDRWTRLYAVNALIRMADPLGLPHVMRRLQDHDARVRWAAVHAVEALGQPLAAGRLRNDADKHVRSAVAEALGSSKIAKSEDDGIPWLRRMADDASAEVRAAAVTSLGQRLASAAEADLLQALSDREPVVRAASIAASRHLDPSQRAALLQQARSDEDATVRSALLAAMALEPGEASFAFINEQLTASDSDIRQAAIRALGSRTEPTAVDACWQAYRANAEAKDTFLRESAASTMGSFPGSASTAHLRAMLQDPVFTVAWLAHEALLRRGITDIQKPVETLTYSPYRDIAVPAHPIVALRTSRGLIRLRLNTNAAPVHVANFVGLVKSHFFDGKTWQRVVPNFVIQGGSPSALGAESQDYMLRAEINTRRFNRGSVGMSRSELFNTGDSQLFITHVLAPHLDGQYTEFGEVIEGMPVIDRIEAGDHILTARLQN
ncbi:MAG: HEAT repeat domain-containing protein [Methylococcus sp.]